MTAPNKKHGKTDQQWANMCLNKRRYPDENVARAMGATSLGLHGEDTDELWVYRCPSCRGWHLTKMGSYHRGEPSIKADDPWCVTGKYAKDIAAA